MTVTTADVSAAARLIRGVRRIAVTAHVNPDADAVGSVLGLTGGLKALGLDAHAVLSDRVPDYARFLRGSREIASVLPPDVDLIVCLDVAGIDRVGRLYTDNPAAFGALPILNVDHHRTNPFYGSVNYVDAAASSTSELVYRILEELDAPIDSPTATALLLGVIGDTGSFRNGATTPGAHRTAARLLELGADNQQVAFQLFECKSFAAARLWGMVISGIELDSARGIVFACLTQEMLRLSGATVDDVEGTAEYLRGVMEAEVVILLKETQEHSVRVSMRSRPTVDVSTIATTLGGGGHRQAAGCTILGTMEHAREVLVATYDALNPR